MKNKMFEMGLLLQRIALQVDDDTYEKIEEDLDTVSKELVRLYELESEINGTDE